MRLLLVNPRFEESFWSFRWAYERVLSGKRAVNPPLGLATVAALTPSDWEVAIVDENVESLPLAPEAEIIGVCGMGVQAARQRELLRYYRDAGHYVVAGGSHASLCPEAYAGLADTVVSGEAEYTWPRFCADFERGEPRPFYRESGTVDPADSPVPRFDLLRLARYGSVSLQFSRGCPYRCEFCDIIVMFGRRPRWKPPEQIGRELDALRRQGVREVFFVDDNLIGDRRAAKALLEYLRDYQQRHGYRFYFGTEVSLDVAQDDRLLELLRAANFAWLFIGIESPDEACLREAGKAQNLRGNPLAAVQRIYRHGIDVYAGFIVGFDCDTLATFDRQYRFIVESGIQAAMVGLLTALPHTPLYERLARERRLATHRVAGDNTRLATNVIPRRMGYDDMLDAYRGLFRRLLEDRQIAARIRNKLCHLRDPVREGQYRPAAGLAIVLRLLLHGILPGGVARLGLFLGSLPLTSPHLLPQAVTDWVVGLSLRDYAERYFSDDRGRVQARASGFFVALQSSLAAYRQRGRVAVELDTTPNATPNFLVTFGGWLDRRFFSCIARHLVRVLGSTPVTLTLRIEPLPKSCAYRLDRLLRRLAPYGDRVTIRADESVMRLVPVDSSVFHVLLD